MLEKKLLLLITFTLFCTSFSKAQSTGFNSTVQLWAEVENNPPSITIHGYAPNTTKYTVYRKLKDEKTWNLVASDVQGNRMQWKDTDVETGINYEYRVIKNTSANVVGYISSGIEIPPVDYRGKVLLVHDTTTTCSLKPEIDRWERDVAGDGWEVIRIPVNANDAVTTVKQKIVDAYNNDPENTKTLFIFGRVPIPYSGIIAPDGHADHSGAWPADGYYADMDGTWTDNSVNVTSGSSSRIHNVPGDGKFDQNTFPGDLELQIGRVDMRNLLVSTFPESIFLKAYLDKNHAYRNKHFDVVNRALIDDNFQVMAEGFSASGWRSFSPLCGPENIVTTDYFTTMKNESYLWSYGCGSGSSNNCSGVGSSKDFRDNNLLTVFTMLFGSYFGDWDTPGNDNWESPNVNLLRMALVNGTTLANCWAGRPHWFFHHMGVGENIGYSARVSMNNDGVYNGGLFLKGVHMALMGDPTLRAYMTAPPTGFSAGYDDNGKGILTWEASSDADVLGYNIYRHNDSIGAFVKVNEDFISGTSFIDPCLEDIGTQTYMLRAVKLEVSPSGSFYNLSTGVYDSFFNPVDNIIVEVKADFAFEQNLSQVVLTNNSQAATSYVWDFGDGTTSTKIHPAHTYNSSGSYDITLTASNCYGTNTQTKTVSVTVSSIQENQLDTTVRVFPNPAQGRVTISAVSTQMKQIEIISVAGKIVNSYRVMPGNDAYDCELGNLARGLYIVRITDKDGNRINKKLILE